jgi:hypothetical protein
MMKLKWKNKIKYNKPQSLFIHANIAKKTHCKESTFVLMKIQHMKKAMHYEKSSP